MKFERFELCANLTLTSTSIYVPIRGVIKEFLDFNATLFLDNIYQEMYKKTYLGKIDLLQIDV